MLYWFLNQFLEREGGRPGREEEEWEVRGKMCVGVPFVCCYSESDAAHEEFGEGINQLCLLAFLFLWDGFAHCLLYNVMKLSP